MTVTRHSLRFKCSVKDCPWPKDRDIHVPWCLGIDVEHWADKPTHQHHPKKGMGGNNPLSKIVAILCVTCHDRIDNGTDWGNAVVPRADGKTAYWAFDRHGNTLIDRVLSAAAEGGSEIKKVPSGRKSPIGTAEVPEPLEARSEGQPSAAAPSALTHEQRIAIAQAIKDTEWNRQWHAGDVGNAWIAELGESAEQYLSDFGYQHESLANILRVCAAIPPNMRRAGLRFSHHVVVANLNREDMEMWLEQADTDGWSVAEFRRQVKGTKPRVKRWSLGELRELKDDYVHVGVVEYVRGIGVFLDYLEEQA